MTSLDNTIGCTIKVLPEEQWVEAASTAVRQNATNAPASQHLNLALPDDVIPVSRLAILTSKYWGTGGVRLTVGFLDNPSAGLRRQILSHMNAWSNWANVQFVESAREPQVRISRAGRGYWSYLGTDVLHIAANAPTMNLQGFSDQTPEAELCRVIRHETGHTLGFPHEHMRREIVDRIDRDKAIAHFGAPPNNWSATQVEKQVLTPLDQSALVATAQADIRSIMCYWLPASIMNDGIAVDGGRDIDALDAQFAASLYPKVGVALNLLVHLQGIGDATYRNNQLAGTRGESRRLEGFQIDFSPVVAGLSCRYRARVQGMGDVPWVDAGQFVGTRGQSRYLEGLAIELTGPQSSRYDVLYMAHIQGLGDTGLCSNGQFCGIVDQSRRIEGMLVRIQPK